VLAGLVPGYLTPPWWALSLDDVEERFARDGNADPGRAVTGVKFSLGRGRVLTGRALDPDGKPVEGARVEVTRHWQNSSIQRPGGTTDARGRFSLGGFWPEEEVAALLTLPGRHLVAWVALPMAAEQKDATPVAVTLRPFASVRGRVVDEDGKPVSGAVVRLLQAELPSQTVFSVTGNPTATGTDGTFAFRAAVMPGVSFFVRIGAEGHAESDSHELRARAGGDEGLGDLPLVRANRPLACTVLDPRGVPMAGVRLSASCRVEAGDTVQVQHRATGRTDERGRFRFTGLPRGEVILSANVPGIADQSFSLGQVRSGDTDLRLKLDAIKP
jgi:hypothetical protein